MTDYRPIRPPPAPPPPRTRIQPQWQAPWLHDLYFLRPAERDYPYPENEEEIEAFLARRRSIATLPLLSISREPGAAVRALCRQTRPPRSAYLPPGRYEATRFGTRIYYDSGVVPEIIDDAEEMYWAPYRGWRARLRCGLHPNLPRRANDAYLLHFSVNYRNVWDGSDPDVGRLLAEFQSFLDAHVDVVHHESFRIRRHAPDSAHP